METLVTETPKTPPPEPSSGDGDTSQEVAATQPIVTVKRVVAAAEG